MEDVIVESQDEKKRKKTGAEASIRHRGVRRSKTSESRSRRSLRGHHQDGATKVKERKPGGSHPAKSGVLFLPRVRTCCTGLFVYVQGCRTVGQHDPIGTGAPGAKARIILHPLPPAGKAKGWFPWLGQPRVAKVLVLAEDELKKQEKEEENEERKDEKHKKEEKKRIKYDKHKKKEKKSREWCVGQACHEQSSRNEKRGDESRNCFNFPLARFTELRRLIVVKFFPS